MYSVSHSLAHRGPGATRARARWQPYASPSPSVSSSRSSVASNYLNTPASSVSSSPPTSTHVSSLCDFQSGPKNLTSNPPTITEAPKEVHFRDTLKGRYLTSLVDQTVKSLCEIWPISDIPVVFQTTARVPLCAPSPPTQTQNTHQHIQRQYQSQPHHTRNSQLLSPISPTTPCSPSSTSSLSDQHSGGPTGAAQLTKGAQCYNNLMPLKNFVHEVLRRSRTSGCVLQTALCYLEAVRAKVPDLARKERSGEGVRGESESASRIVMPEEDLVSLQQSLLNISQYVTPTTSSSSEETDTDVLATVCQQSQATVGQSTYAPVMEDGLQKKLKGPSAPLPPMPPLPSPLLCPRRAFLASLILASKFMQDKCYSNRAWAKLTGLHPREIGRCERALGEMLEWRLWVGKVPSRAVTRCKSEGDLLRPASKVEESGGFLAPNITRPSMLRRCSTVPALPSGGYGVTGEDSVCASSMGGEPQPAAFGPSTQDFARTSSLSALFFEGAPSINPITSMDVSSSSIPFSTSWSSTPTNMNPIAYCAYADTSPPTPTLVYSPTSTASSSSSDGDRTIQISSLPDADVPTPLQHFPPLFGGFDAAKAGQPFGPMVAAGSQMQVDVTWHQAVSGVLGYAPGGSLYQR